MSENETHEEPEHENPYSATYVSQEPDSLDQSLHSAGTENVFRSLGNWQMGLAVFALVITAIGFIVMVAAVVLQGDGPGGAIGGGLCMGVAFLVFYVLPSVMLWQAARASKEFAQFPNEQTLMKMGTAQRAFWRLIAIMIILVCIMYLLIFLFLGIGMRM